MKISDLIKNTFTTNEEKVALDKLDRASPLRGFSERDQVIIEALIRKSLVSKFNNGSTLMVVKNDGGST
jgi:hypothetical protein|tara:strand:- start:946 stop:1152 length:207 start_codon:yes stop_codon:yes gene_type:complete